MAQHAPLKKRRKRSNSPRFSPTWLWVGGITAIALWGVLLLTTRTTTSNAVTSPEATPVTVQNPKVTPQVTGAPRLVVVQDTFDYGDVQLGRTLQTVFRLDNVGDQALTILNKPTVQVVEGCCPPQAMLSSTVIQPGGEATITINFMMHQGMAGKHRFNIDVKTNDPSQPDKQLVVLSNWI